MNKTILIIEDEIRIRFLLKDYLLSEGFSVIEACDGEEGLMAFKNNNVDLILLDIMMPKLDGYSACKEIKKTKNIPVIMLSARGEEYDKIHGFEVGVDDYVVKPFSPRELMMRINAVINRSQKTVKKDIVEGELGTEIVPGNPSQYGYRNTMSEKGIPVLHRLEMPHK